MRLTGPRLRLKTARVFSYNIGGQLYRGTLTPRHVFENKIASSFPPPSGIGINILVCQATCDVVTLSKKQSHLLRGLTKRDTSLLSRDTVHAEEILYGVVLYCFGVCCKMESGLPAQ